MKLNEIIATKAEQYANTKFPKETVGNITTQGHFKKGVELILEQLLPFESYKDNYREFVPDIWCHTHPGIDDKKYSYMELFEKFLNETLQP